MKMDKIIHGDSKEELKKLADNSVDLLCTDPPYGYSFMGKSWDKTLPDIEIFKECFRVLKDGAFAFVMSAPRSDVCARMMLMLEEAGFEIGFTPIYWTYASGFPKAMNIGKMVDKRMGATPIDTGVRSPVSRPNVAEDLYQSGKVGKNFNITKVASEEAQALDGSYGGFQPKPAVEVIIVAMKPLSEKTFVDQALKNGKGVTWLDDCRVPLGDDTSLAKKNPHTKRENSKAYTEIYGEYQASEYELPTGRFPANLLVSDDVLNDGRQTSSKARTKPSDSINKGYYGGGFKSADNEYDDSGSYSRYFSLDAWAKTLPFLIVPKASKGEKNEGLGGTCTVKYNTGVCKDVNLVAVQLLEKVISDTATVKWRIDESGENITGQCQSDSLSTTKTTISKTIASQILNSLMLSLTSASIAGAKYALGNGGSRVKGAEHLAKWIRGITKGETALALGASDVALKTLQAINAGAEWKPDGNIHPTCKPLTLMSYLVTLGSRPGDLVLEPFAGSGTTCLAAKNLNRHFIGIEREKEYVEIARARIKNATPVQQTLVA